MNTRVYLNHKRIAIYISLHDLLVARELAAQEKVPVSVLIAALFKKGLMHHAEEKGARP